MKYKDMTPEQIERVFAEDVLGWEIKQVVEDKRYRAWHDGKQPLYTVGAFHPLINTNLAMLGVEKLKNDASEIEIAWYNNKWQTWFFGNDFDLRTYADTLNAAIVEACIRIKRPDLFEGE